MEIAPTVESDGLRNAQAATPLSPPGSAEIDPKVSARGIDLLSSETRRRAKSALRLKYEAETHVIERKLGDLEAIREKLGLSQRKIAQLLLVDPSAWTRWTKGGDEAPPHIYRMLQWYLALEEKYPALDVNFWLNTVAQLPDNRARINSQQIEQVVELRISEKQLQIESVLRAEFSKRKRSLQKLIVWMTFAATLAGAVIGFSVALIAR